MGTGKRALMTGVSILMMAAGCSKLENDFLPTVQSVDGEACGTCHMLPQKTKNHFLHMYDTTMDVLFPLVCNDCHTGYDGSRGWIEPSLHRNGLIDTCPADCDYCHDYRRDCNACHETPPDHSDKLKKIHKHVTQQDIKCGVCHKGYDLDKKLAPLHGNDKVDVIFDVGLIFDADKKPVFPLDPVFSNDSCYNLYCHGAFTNGGKPVVTVNDTKPQGAPDQCNFCHDLNGLYQLTGAHRADGLSRVAFQDCLICHAGFSANQGTTDESLHRNGIVDTIPKANRVR